MVWLVITVSGLSVGRTLGVLHGQSVVQTVFQSLVLGVVRWRRLRLASVSSHQARSHAMERKKKSLLSRTGVNNDDCSSPHMCARNKTPASIFTKLRFLEGFCYQKKSNLRKEKNKIKILGEIASTPGACNEISILLLSKNPGSTLTRFLLEKKKKKKRQ